MKIKLINTALLSMALSACGGSDNSNPDSSTGNLDKRVPVVADSFKGTTERRAKGAPNSDLNDLAHSNANFAFDVYHQLTKDDSNINLVASPHSMSVAFSMLYAGADGNTAAQLKDVFHFNLPTEQLHQAFNTIDQTLAEANSAEGLSLSIINSQWGETTYDFDPDYGNTLSEFYGADIKLTDFIDQAEPSRQLINSWVEQQTRDLIKDLMPEGSIDQDTRLVLVNAVYFNGEWENKFPAEQTDDQDFTYLDGTLAQVETMHYRHDFNYFDDGNETIIELPYKGGAFSMYLLHSHVDQFTDMETSLSADVLNQKIEQMVTGDIRLSLPKFSFGGKTDLKTLLSSMGVTDAFSGSKADFSPMNQRDEQELFVQAALHQAFITVNEDGTEAGAATGISAGIESMPDFIELNSPFIFVIRHNETGEILFIGRVLDPKTS